MQHIVIVGGGIFGASTAYHLLHGAGDTPRVTLIDRSPPSHGIGASDDLNKIIRGDYSKRCYMELAYEAIGKWHEWNALGEVLEGLYHNTGWVMLDRNDSDLSERIRKCYRAWTRDPTQDLDMPTIRSSWNGILSHLSPEYTSAYFNPEAGWAEAGTAVTRLIAAAQAKGMTLITGEVTGLAHDGSKVRAIRLADGREVAADTVVLATGAWTEWLLDPLEEELHMPAEMRIGTQLTAAGVCVAHYRATGKEREDFEQMPVVVYGEHGEALPLSKDGWVKLTNSTSFTSRVINESGRSISRPPFQDQSIVSPGLRSETLHIIGNIFPSLAAGGRQPDYWRLCWDAVTPTQDQLICRHPHPRLHNLVLATGGSFHSYKFLPVIGKYVVNVVKGRTNGAEWDRRWAWKGATTDERGAHEKVVPQRDLSSIS